MSEVTRKVYEITEDLRRDLISGRLKETKPKSLDGLHEELLEHYRKNLTKIISEAKKKGVKVQYWGGYYGPEDPSQFSKGVALYSDCLFFKDWLEHILAVRHVYSSKGLAADLREASKAFEDLRSLTEKDMLVLFPDAIRWTDNIRKWIKKASKTDAEVLKAAVTEVGLKDMMEDTKRLSPKVIRKESSVKNIAFKSLTIGAARGVNSSLTSSRFFGSELTTDDALAWRYLNLIVNKRHPRTPVPAVTQALGSIELPFLRSVELETILRVREEHADVFETWREGWRSACSGLERITDPAEFNEELKRIRFDIINPNLEKMDKWRGAMRPLGGIFKGLGAVPITLGAFFGNLPLGLAGAAFVEPLALEYGKDLAKWLVDNVMHRNFVYFLWKVKEAS